MDATISRAPDAIAGTVGLRAPTNGGISLEDLFRRGQHFALLRIVLAELDRSPDDATLHLLAARSYIALGLIGPARELLTGGGPLAAMPAFRPLLAHIADLPSGQVPWDRLRDKYHANSSRLFTQHPHLRPLGPAFEAVMRTHDLFRTIDGRHLLTRRPDAGRRQWTPALSDDVHAAAHAALPHPPNALFCGPYIVTGDRFGLLFDRVFDATRKMFMTFRPRLYVIEPDAALFGAALFARRDVEALCDERVSIFVGESCADALANALQADPTRAIPEYVVGLPPTDTIAAEDVVAALRTASTHRDTAVRSHIAAANEHYTSLPADFWQGRFRLAATDGAPLRILGITSRFTTVLQYAMRDLKSAFERMGHEFRTVIDPGNFDPMTPVYYTEAVSSFRPDLIVNIDHLRSEFGRSLPANVPYVAWIQDALPNLMNRSAGQSIGPLDFYIAPALHELVRAHDYPRSQGMVWTMATDETVYSSAPLPEAELILHRCDFSYVSNQSTPPEHFRDQWRERVGNAPAGRLLVDQIYEVLRCEQAADPRTACTRPATRVMREACEQCGVRPSNTGVHERLMREYLHVLAELMFRQETLAWVADFCERTGRTLRLHGQGWENHPRFAKFACGVVANGRALRAVYQASRINLQIASHGAIHQRLLDGLAAGGFFLLRWTPCDVARDACERLLAAVDRYGIKPDEQYVAAAVPDAASALDEIGDFDCVVRDPSVTCLTTSQLDRYREFETSDYRRMAGAVFPEYPQIAFGSPSEFESAAHGFLADSAACASLAESMRNNAVGRYSYQALVKDMLAFIAQRLGCVGSSLTAAAETTRA